MKQGKRAAPKFPIEYRLLITPKYKERENKTVILVALRTVNEFTNFHYEIIVQEKVSDGKLQLDIHGLRAPQVTIPGMGPALFQKEFTNLNGTYEIIISKLHREMNTFSAAISNEKVVVTQSPDDRFVDIVTRAEDW